MSVLTIKSAKLGRMVRIVSTSEEARQVWKEFTGDRGGIYLADEVRAMKGIDPESLRAIQKVKDVFHGAQVQQVEIIMHGGEQ